MRFRTGGSIRNRNTAGTCNSYRLPAKTHKPIASVAALPARLAGWQVIGWHRRPRNASKFVIARPQRGRGNLGKAAAFLPIAFPRFSRVLQDCHVSLRPPRNDNSGAFAILTAACTNRQFIAGPGCPLPYNAYQRANYNAYQRANYNAYQRANAPSARRRMK